MKKIILFSTISVLLSACGGSSSRDNAIATDNGIPSYGKTLQLSTGQTINIQGTGLVSSVDQSTTPASSATLNTNLRGNTYVGGWSTSDSYAVVETNHAGYTSIPHIAGRETTDIPVSGTANYAGEVYGVTRLLGGYEAVNTARPVNPGVSSGDARLAVDFTNKQVTEAYFGNIEVGNGTKKVKETTVDASGQIVEKEVTKTLSYSVRHDLVGPTSFADVQNGNAKLTTTLTTVEATDGVIDGGDIRYSSNDGYTSFTTGMTKDQAVPNAKLTGNFYGAGAKEIAGKIIMDKLSDQDGNAAFHARKQ